MNNLAGDWVRDQHRKGIEQTKEAIRNHVGENTLSQIINGAISAYGRVVDLGSAGVDTVVDIVSILGSCAAGHSYCYTAVVNLGKKGQTLYNAVNSIINGDAWESIKGTFIQASRGVQKALEDVSALIISAMVPATVGCW